MFARIAHLTICHLLCSHSKQHKVGNSHRRDGAKDGERSIDEYYAPDVIVMST